MYAERLTRLLAAMEEEGFYQLVITDPASIFYLTGQFFSPGQRMLVLYLRSGEEPLLFLNDLFPLPADFSVTCIRFNDVQDGVEILADYVNRDRRMGVDKSWSARFLLRLMQLNGGSGFENASWLLDRLRMCKDAEEIDYMKEAARVNDLAMQFLRAQVSATVTEKDLTRRLLPFYEAEEAQGFSFSPIAAFGEHAADPHHAPSNASVQVGNCVLFDIGCRKQNYCSDMTRTFFYRQVDALGVKIYEIVRGANEKAIEAVRPGAQFCEIDAAARDYIEAAGYGSQFLHRTGHSIGIETHEFGDVSAGNTQKLQPGMIFSIEPGIYLPGQVGVRVEDLVLVTEDGCEVLTHYSKELSILE